MGGSMKMEDQKEILNKHYNKPENKRLLINLIRKHGEYISFHEDKGFLYSVDVGNNIYLEVLLDRGTIIVQNIKK